MGMQKILWRSFSNCISQDPSICRSISTKHETKASSDSCCYWTADCRSSLCLKSFYKSAKRTPAMQGTRGIGPWTIGCFFSNSGAISRFWSQTLHLYPAKTTQVACGLPVGCLGTFFQTKPSFVHEKTQDLTKPDPWRGLASRCCGRSLSFKQCKTIEGFPSTFANCWVKEESIWNYLK